MVWQMRARQNLAPPPLFCCVLLAAGAQFNTGAQDIPKRPFPPARARGNPFVHARHRRLGKLSLSDSLAPPSDRPYNFSAYRVGSYNGQLHQDQWVDEVLGKKEKLFVVESGAFNGEENSNSLFFETNRKWACLLVEANPFFWPQIYSRHRKCHVLRGGLSITGQASTFPFRVAGQLGGITQTMSKGHSARVDGAIRQNSREVVGMGQTAVGGFIEVTTYPLVDVLHAMNRTVVDYWSLDVEGAEAAILQNTDFSKIEVGVLTVEHNGDAALRASIKQIAEKHKMKRVGATNQDDYFASPNYFQRRGLPFGPFPSPCAVPHPRWLGCERTP